MIKQFCNINLDNIKQVTEYLFENIKQGWTIGLSGELGTGKTYIAGLIIKKLGITDTNITSPTFTILNQYYNKNKDFYVNHFDVYRIESEFELEDLGYYDFINNSGYINIIEWSDKIKNELPDENIILVSIDFADDIHKRNYNIRLI